MIAFLISIQVLELIFVLIALFGLVFSSMNIRRANKLINHLEDAGLLNGRYRLAKFARHQESMRAVIQTILIIVGSSAFILPPSSIETLPLSWRVAAETIRWGLISVAAIVSYKSYAQWNFQRTFKLDKPSSNYEDV